jgi:putative transposase
LHTLSHKIRLKTTPEHEKFFSRACGVARFAYNWALGKCNQIRLETGKNPSIPELKKQFNALKEVEFPWIYDSPKDANQQPFTHLQKAWKRFWEGAKQGKHLVWDHKQKKELLAEGVKISQMSFAPTFKRKKDNHHSFYLSNDKFSLEGKKVKLPKLGWLEMTEKVRFEGRVLSGNISREGQYWYLSITLEVSDAVYFKPRTEEGIVGVDLGIKHAAILSTGEPFENPKPYRTAKRRLIIRQRRVSRKQETQLEGMGLKGKPIPKGTQIPQSNNQKKAQARVNRVHARVVNVRRDFQHKTTTKIIRKNQAVVIENLYVAGMLQNRKLSSALSDVGLGEIRRQLEYKALRYQTLIHVADRWFPSSKLCSDCGWKNTELKLSAREWVCLECGVVHDRDINAAINLRNLLLPRGYSESHASPDLEGNSEMGSTREMPSVGNAGQETKHAESV